MTTLAYPDLALEVGEIESLDTPAWNWGAFFAGVGVGVGLVGIAAGVALT